MLIAHYDPGSCYGIPPSQEEPEIKIVKEASGWHYNVQDGKCCDITIYEGTVTGEGARKRIDESSKSNKSVPC